MLTLGFDTSNYTTSVAAFDGVGGKNCSRLLDVKPGELGLRQSDALFAHIPQVTFTGGEPTLRADLPELVDALCASVNIGNVTAIGVSTRPRAVEGSYMPCFLAGWSQASCLAKILNVPLYEFSHQQGHIAASLWSAGRLELMQTPHLAWHLSGGTTELLLVTPDGKTVRAEKLGGTSDISAGQLIDRTGKLLGLPFPAGKAVDALSRESDCKERYRVKLNGLEFSFSGIQNKAETFYSDTQSAADTARFVMNCIVSCIADATRPALAQYPGLPVVFSGGVASNSMLRERMREFAPVFAEPQYSTDNAMGIAVLTALQEGV